MGNLSLLQQISPTQELNQGLLHCRWIIYQLSYQGSPYMCVGIFIFSLLFKVATELRIEEFRGQEGKLVFELIKFM